MRQRSMLLLFLLLLLPLLLPGSLPAQELNFKEAYALGPDRAKVLERLVPGTRDYYWYHALYHQGRGDLAQVDELLAQWRKRHGRTERNREIERRQALLRFGREPAETLAWLRRELSLEFDHLREKGADRPDLATRLDPGRLSRQTLVRKALQVGGNTLRGFEDRALEWRVA